MKKATALLLALLGLSLNSCIIGDLGHHVSGNGHVTEEIIDVSGFSGVHVSAGIDVQLTEADAFEVVLEADENLHEYIEIYERDHMLVVGVEHGVNIGRAKAKTVHVSLPRLEELRISSAGDCYGQNTFHCGDVRIDVSSAGDLRLDLEADNIRLGISSSGDCRLNGSAESLNASLSSAGDLDASGLIASRVEVSVSSAGDARVHATDEISMTASSAGNIYYSGDAKVVHQSKSSAGNIVKN